MSGCHRALVGCPVVLFFFLEEAKEVVEGRGLAEGKTLKRNVPRTQSRKPGATRSREWVPPAG
jgi:hypothetical protein